jgi:hypothetical protein
MEILNIDAFAETKRQLKMDGKVYPVEESTVQEFINNLKAAEDLEKSGVEKNLAESFEGAVKVVTDAIPTLPKEEILKLKMPAMMAVLQFIRGDLDPTMLEGNMVQKTQAATEGAEGAEPKKPT